MLKAGLFILLISNLAGCSIGKTIETSPLVNSAAQIEQAQQFNVLPDRANVYIKMKEGYRTLLVDGRKQGVLKSGQYLNFSVDPGIVGLHLRRSIPYAEDYEHLKHLVFADFDLGFEAGSVVLIECTGSENTDMSLISAAYKRPPGDALRKFSDCPEETDLSSHRGVKACAIAFREKTYTVELTPEGWKAMTAPEGQCFLVTDREAFTTAELVVSERPHVTSFDYQMEKAKSLNTVAAFESVLAMYPGTSRKPEIERAIKSARLEEAHQVRKQQIEDRLKRDSHLPLQVQQDKYMLTLKDLLTKQDFETALFYFELLDTMGVQLSPSVGFFWGEALVRTGRPKPALEKLYAYIKAEGSKGQFYERALVLSSEAEALL
jgi:hypothetical protein